MRYRPWILLALLCAACEKLPPQQEHFERGLKAYNKGDFAMALLYLKPLVEVGNPAAQLVMSKMYAHGDGVPEDMQKSELLRNLASFQIYKKKDYAPGSVRSDNATLTAISKRLDYYVDAGDAKQAPVQDPTKILEAFDAKGIVDLQKAGSNFEDGPVSIDLPKEPYARPDEKREPEAEVSVPDAPLAPLSQLPRSDRPDISVTGNSRRSDQISLTLIQQAAAKGDPMAMELLSAAYQKGFYSVKISSVQAILWATNAKAARQNQPTATDEDPDEQRPMIQVWGLVGLGVALMGVGLWRWRKTHFAKESGH